MADIDYAMLAERLLRPVQQAGRAIMAHYARGASYTVKADASPVTAADHDSERILLAALAEVAAGIPVISEESQPDGAPAPPGPCFFLVDPLDGTREFINKRPDFTVNVALVERGRPRFGIVYAPASADLYVTPAPDLAVRARLDTAGPDVVASALERQPLATRPADPARLTAVASRSHINEATRRYLDDLGVTDLAQAGSSLKFCTIARGDADVYPRLSPTMEWDTAAGHAVLSAAGGTVLDLEGAPLDYGHAQRAFRNPSFIAWGRSPGAGS